MNDDEKFEKFAEEMKKKGYSKIIIEKFRNDWNKWLIDADNFRLGKY